MKILLKNLFQTKDMHFSFNILSFKVKPVSGFDDIEF